MRENEISLRKWSGGAAHLYSCVPWRDHCRQTFTFVETSCLKIDTCNFELSQKDESRDLSADSSKAYSKLKL